MTKDLTTIEKKIIPLVQDAKSLKITSSADMEVATILLSNLNKINDEIDKEKQKVLKPLNEARTAEINRWRPSITLYETAITDLRQKLSDYQTHITYLNNKAINDISNRVGEGKGSFKLETAIKKIEALPTPIQSVSTTAGTLKFRAVQRLKIVNADLIPRKYLIPDEVSIEIALQTSQPVAGCTLETIQVPVNHR